MIHIEKLAFLFDVDNTLLDNDRVTDDLRRHLERDVGPARAKQYWNIFEELRERLGYADYLGALQRYRAKYPHDLRLLTVSTFLLNYEFSDRLYRGAFDAIRYARRLGTAALLTDGDVVFQPNKVHRSGLYQAVSGRMMVYVHKEKELKDVERRLPAEHYVMVDDKLRILSAMKKAWGRKLTTVFVRQGHYALDPAVLKKYPPADVSIGRIGELARNGEVERVLERGG